MLFTVVIPTFNRAELLARALESVWGQRFTDFEVIVVDDGSTDGTRQWVESQSGRLQVLSQPNLGPGAARNAGARQARGEYLAFLDSDDLWFPWTLASFAELIRQYRSPSILGARLVGFSGEAELAATPEAAVRAVAFPDYFASHRTGYFVGAGMSVLRRDEFLKSGGYTERRINAEDHDLILRLGVAPGFVQILEPITLGWRRHVASMSHDLALSFEGQNHLVAGERAGRYPGGTARRRERRCIITKHTRPVAVELLKLGRAAEAWALYRATFAWHCALGRWKFLFGFPLKAAMPSK